MATHAITQGNLVGEVVRRISGRSLGTFLREELAEPLGADFHVGVDPAHFHRIGELIPPPVHTFEVAHVPQRHGQAARERAVAAIRQSTGSEGRPAERRLDATSP